MKDKKGNQVTNPNKNEDLYVNHSKQVTYDVDPFWRSIYKLDEVNTDKTVYSKSEENKGSD